MKQHGTSRTVRRLKLAGLGLAGLIGGIALLIFSRSISPPPPQEAAATQPTATQQATATQAANRPPGTPATQPSAPGPNRERLAAANMSGLTLLFSMMGFILAVVCAGWIVYDIRAARAAWMRQPKYPKRTRR